MQRPSTLAVYLITAAASAFLNYMVFVVLTVYYVQAAGMNPLLLVLAGTAQKVTIVLFEVPTGVIADTYSRRLSVIIGYALGGLCFLVQGLLPLAGVILLAEFARGVAYTFVSGAEDAWLADEIGEPALAMAFLRRGQVARIGGIAGLVAGAGLGALRFQLPIVVAGILGLALPLFLLAAMRETTFRPARRAGESHWRALGGTLREGLEVVRSRPVILMLLASGIIYGTFSEGFDRLWEAHFLLGIGFPAFGALTPVVWLGGIQIGAKLVGIAASEIALRRLRLHERIAASGQATLARGLIAAYAILIAAVVGFGLAGGFPLAVAAFWLATAAHTVGGPLYETWLNQNVRSSVRATVLSLSGQANALGQSLGGPALGGLATVASLRAAIVLAGFLLAPVTLLYARTLRRYRAAPLIADTPSAQR